MMRLEDDSNFYFIQNTYDIDNKEQIIKQEIKKVTAGFTFCNSYTVYKNTTKNIIKSMNMDTNTKKIIILKKMWNEDEEKLIDSQFSVYDLKTKQIIYESIVKFKPLIGRLE